MARLLMKAMAMGGHDVSVASELRSFLKQADDPARSLLADAATHEIETITERWQREGAPEKGAVQRLDVLHRAATIASGSEVTGALSSTRGAAKL